ncbi:MAG: HigA family addiction module antidote protein, partial [Spiribacter salinus]
ETDLARRLHMSRQSLHRILAQEQPVTSATALKLARLPGTSSEVWLNMQRTCDLWEQRRKLSAQPDSIEPVAA